MYHPIQLTATTSSVSTLLSRSPRRRRRILCALAAAPTLLFLLLRAATAFGGSATWSLNPPGNFWSEPTDWTPATVPNGPADTATFGVSNQTAVFGIQSIEVNGILFDIGASPFIITGHPDVTFDQFLTISGVGITNNSGVIQTFVSEYDPILNAAVLIQFTNNARAGALTVFNNDGGDTQFFDTASAGSSTFNNNAPPGSYSSGHTDFFDHATAENATVVANGSVPGSGLLGGFTTFQDTATAGNAFLIANGGLTGGVGGIISFNNDSLGGTARVQVVGNGTLDISAHNAPGVTVGLIEGSGRVHLGSNNLTVGSNNLGTTFSGTIDGVGSLAKIGTGTLVLSRPNVYTGGTTIESGKLTADNIVGSATGTGPVQVNAGTFGGRGTIAGAVTVGTGTGPGAILTPEKTTGAPDVLTLQSALTFNSDAIYEVGLKTKGAIAGKTVANGVTIQSGASFSFVVHQHRVLRAGTLLTVLENTAGPPIAGAFSNLPDGSTFTVGLNIYKVSYEGGDGNDLTLTVE